MGHKDLNGNEEQIRLLRREITVKIRVSSENQPSEARRAAADSAVVRQFTTETPATQGSNYEFKLDKKWIIDPDLLRVGEKIGEGAHGKVYEGRYGDMSVAIKVLQRPETSEEQVKLESRFAREVDMMSRVQHRNLVKFIGACKDPIMAIVTELLPGRSLRKHLISLRPNQLDLYVALNFALDIAHAMDCLHINGIIHRDLKPGTVGLQSPWILHFWKDVLPQGNKIYISPL